MKHVIVAYDKTRWCAVPANNGGNGPSWQWGDELLVGFTEGTACFTGGFHQVDEDRPLLARLARSLDGGETWQVHVPRNYQGDTGFRMEDAGPLPVGLDFASSGFVMRVEGHGYHGNAGQQWFCSLDRGRTWNGPYTFGALLSHPELAGWQFTGRTAYLVDGPAECLLFLSARRTGKGHRVSDTDRVFLARTTDGGVSFAFVAWIVPPSDPARALMPAPVRLGADRLVAAIRRRHKGERHAWIDCFGSADNGRSWSLLAKVGDAGPHNGNPPAMIGLADGRLCCVYGDRDRALMLAKFSADAGKSWGPELILRDEFKSVNGFPDLGYPRLFQRPDGRLVTVYFWCSPARPETHIEATLFDAP